MRMNFNILPLCLRPNRPFASPMLRLIWCAPLLGLLLELFSGPSHAQSIPYNASYSSAPASFTIAAAATDIACFEGTAKPIAIYRLEVHGHAPVTSSFGSIQLTKRSTLNTGGTSTVTAAVPHSSANAAATLVTRTYTANPAALGTSLGIVDEIDVMFPTLAVGITMPPNMAVYDYRFSQPIILNAATDALCISLPAGSAHIGNAAEIRAVWTE
jgi:hypothetical protein